MAGGSRHTAPARGDTLDLLTMALARPGEALARARAVIAADPDPYEASVARQTVGIVLRDFGDVSAAVRELRAALRLAGAAGSSERQADVQATLGLTLVTAGRAGPGLAALDAAARQASGAQAGRIRYRRGAALRILGQQREALAELTTAVAALRRADDPIWEARALTARAMTRLALGATEQANVDFGHAERLLAATSQELELAFARQNWALLAFRSGDLPAALAHFDEAALRYQALAVPVPDLAIDRCAVLLAAGLAADALREADLAIGDLDRLHGQAIKKAELLLTAAGAALGIADPRTAMRRAQAAAALFSAQQRPWWHAHARLVLLQARYAAGLVTGQLLAQAARNAESLEALGSSDAPQARLLAGRAGLALARMNDAERHLRAAARARRQGPALSRVDGWLAEALLAEAAGSPRAALGACRRGFDVLDDHRLTLGASELRARATARGGELAALAQRQALRAGRPRMLLFWSERWRATTLALPPVRPVEDQALHAELTALRDATSRLEKSQAEGTPAPRFQREQLRLERAIRARVIRARGSGRSGQQGFSAAALLDELGDAALIQIVEIDGDLHPLVCRAGQVRHFAAGRAADAAREVSFARFGLNRIAHTRATAAPENSLALLEAAGRRLEDILLGPARAHLGDGPVIVVPPGRLHAVPWALLPSLRDRVLSVAPSSSAWMRARAAAPAGRGIVLVRGPDLGSQGAEVPALAAEYGDATVLGDGSATAARVLAAIDGSLLAHIAAHGSFRADSPLFSSLRLDDGPLTVHDLERLKQAPHRLILPSCESGLLAPAGADELLGLASALVPLGTAGIVASITRVNDKATVGLMLALHQRLRRGGTLSEALRDARGDAGDDPVQTATGWSFVALGAG